MGLLLSFAATAQAKLVGEFIKFQYCPYETEGVSRCVYSANTGGEIVLGNKTVTVEKEVILQGGYSEPATEGPDEGFGSFFAATNGETLTKVPQNVPGACWASYRPKNRHGWSNG